MNSPAPYCNINGDNKAKAQGRIATPKNGLSGAIRDRILKANAAWVMIKGKLLVAYGVNTKLRIMIFGPLVSSILLYLLHIDAMGRSSIDKLQKFRSECARTIARGYFRPETTQARNGIIRQKYNIATMVESKLKYTMLKS